MKFFLVSDDRDTVTGLRLAGIEGVFSQSEQTASEELDKAMNDADVGIVLITHGVYEMCRETIDNFKVSVTSPLIVEIPDSKNTDGNTGNIMEYVNNAIGVKM